MAGGTGERREGESLEEDRNTQIKTELRKNDIPNLYFAVQDSIYKYFEYIEAKNAEAVKNILEEKYCATNGITEDNVLENSPQIVDFQSFKVKDMYLIEKENKYKNYVYGVISTGENSYAWYGEVNTDYNVFTLEPLGKEDYENIIQNKTDTGEKNLVRNSYNQFIVNQISEEQLCRYYFEDYKDKLLNDYEVAFDMLEEQYKEKRFQNDISKFIQYIEDNKQHIELATLLSYSTYNDSYEGNRIVLKDNYDNYYTLYENAVMDYRILLDTYTIPTEEYLQKYNTLSLESRAINNVEIVINMINNKDYEKLYSLLDETFKSNNFATLDVYKNYMREHFFDYNILGSKKIKEINGVFVCKVFLKDSPGSAYESKEQTFIIKLGEGTDFVMSFQL